MPGTLVRDANRPVLINAATLTANANGTAVDVGRPNKCRAVLAVTGAVSGTTPTLDVELQASDDSTFATGVVSLGRFGRATASLGTASRYILVDVMHRYVRAVSTVGGTTPSFAGVTVTLDERNLRRTKGDTA